MSNPPVASRKETVRTVHGRTLKDDYGWLRDPAYPEVNDPDILAYLEAENAYADAFQEPDKPLIDQLYAELRGRLKEDDASVPVAYGPYLYGWRFAPGAQYRTWYRTAPDGSGEAVFLDEPMLAADAPYFSLRSYSPSPDHRLIAFSTDRDGSERYRLEILDTQTGETLPDVISNTSGVAAWADRETLFYVELNEQLRPFRVRRHRLGTPASSDGIVYEEADQGFFVNVQRTLSDAWILIGTGDHVTTEWRCIPTAAPDTDPKVMVPRRPGHEYNPTHRASRFVITTNDKHRNFRLVEVDDTDPAEANWREILAPSDEVYVLGATGFRDFLAVTSRERGLVQIRLHRDGAGAPEAIAWPEPAYAASLGNNLDYAATKLRLGYSSMVTPQSVLDYDVETGELTTLKVQEIPSGYDAGRYRTERLEAVAADGARVPISIVYRDDFKIDGTGDLHLYGYGSYGMGLDPSFSSSRLSLLDRGFAVAIAHIRGGDEMGRGWYEDGKLEKKTNTFTDFIACAEHLIAEGYTAKGRIAIEGGSAGGMLMGAVLNMAPELWRCSLALVPFVDVLNTMLDASLPLTPIEWPEWGDPITDPEAYDRLLGYSPYDQVQAVAYPAILARAGISDPRVTYWEPAKWVAKLRAMKTDDNPLLLRTNMTAGHGGASGRFDRLQERAEDFAFVLRCFEKTGH